MIGEKYSADHKMLEEFLPDKYSSEYEILYVTGISNLSLLAYNTFPYSNLFFDFVFWILPQYFVIMYPGRKQEIFIFLFNLINFNELKFGNIFGFDMPRTFHRGNINQQEALLKKSSNNKLLRRFNHSVIGILRSYISLQVAVCILAVDFTEMYPLKFTKSVSYGYKLMDMGVGSYLYNGGIMASKSKYKGIINLIILGIVRLSVIRYFNLEVDIREYGKHSNFYFILSGVYLIYKLCTGIFNKKVKYLPYPKRCIKNPSNSDNSSFYTVKNSVSYINNIVYRYIGHIILFVYYGITKYLNLDKLILSNDRSNFILENKESFFVIIPFVSLLVIMQDLSKILFYSGKNDKIEYVIKYKIISLMKYTGIFYILYKVFEACEIPSRRLGNPTFIFFVLYLHTLHLLIYVFVCLVSKLRFYKAVEFSSRNMMTNFLITNLLVLLTKRSISLSKDRCHIVMLTYLVISFIIPPLLYCK
jgi:glucosaminylphosphatidylinositol acyltransferase